MSGIKEFGDVDEWLKHDTRGGTRGGKTLKGEWKSQSKEGGKVMIYLHPKAMPVALWQHNFPLRRAYTPKDAKSKDEKVIAYWGQRITCHDPEEILTKRYFRNRDGSREHPPQDCPMCKLIEWVYQGVVSGELRYDEVLFDFNDATDPKNNATLHAGPFAGITQKTKFLPEHLYEQIAAARVRDAWAESALASARYVLTCVNVDAVKDGLQILAEGPSVGESIKKQLKDRIHAIGDKGNFLKHPKPLLITYDKLTQDPKEKYRVQLMDVDMAPITEEITNLLQSPVPQLGKEYQPFDTELLRAQLETGARVSLPFDDFFGNVAKVQQQVPASVTDMDDAGDDDFPFGANAPDELKVEKHMIPCDNCGKMMLDTDTKCKHCGAVYDLVDDDPPKEELKNPNRRAGI